MPRSTEVQPGFTRFDTLTPPTFFFYTYNPHFYLHTHSPNFLVTYTQTCYLHLHLIHTSHTYYSHTGNTHTTTLFTYLLHAHLLFFFTLSYTAIVLYVFPSYHFYCSTIILLSYHSIISHCSPPCYTLPKCIHSLSFLKLILPVTSSEKDRT